MINVTVVYALPALPTLVSCSVNDNATVLDAINASLILDKHNLTLDALQVGIYSTKVTLDTKVKEGDRIEIYRPLINDPKEIRRKRALKNKSR